MADANYHGALWSDPIGPDQLILDSADSAAITIVPRCGCALLIHNAAPPFLYEAFLHNGAPELVHAGRMAHQGQTESGTLGLGSFREVYTKFIVV